MSPRIIEIPLNDPDSFDDGPAGAYHFEDLANFTAETSENGSDVDGDTAGLIAAIRIAPANIRHHYIQNGDIYLALAHSDGSDVDSAAGLIAGIGPGDEPGKWEIADGAVSIPPAGDGLGGIIDGAGWLPEGETAPKVADGKVLFPKAPEPTQQDIPLANYNGSNVDNVPGLICGIERRQDISSDRIQMGVIQIAVPDTSDVDGGGLGMVYQFDPAYFVVTGNTVTMSEDALDSIVAEAVGEIGVTVTSEGALTSTEYGQLNYRTTTTNTDIQNFSLETEVGY